jgi:hypothetical protein
VWHLEAIAQHPRRIRGQIRLQRYALAVHVAAHQDDHLQHGGVHVEPFLPR